MRRPDYRPDLPVLQVLRQLAGLLFALLLMASLPIPAAHGAAPDPATAAAAD